jgi:hypothetical protein
MPVRWVIAERITVEPAAHGTDLTVRTLGRMAGPSRLLHLLGYRDTMTARRLAELARLQADQKASAIAAHFAGPPGPAETADSAGNTTGLDLSQPGRSAATSGRQELPMNGACSPSSKPAPSRSASPQASSRPSGKPQRSIPRTYTYMGLLWAVAKAHRIEGRHLHEGSIWDGTLSSAPGSSKRQQHPGVGGSPL